MSMPRSFRYVLFYFSAVLVLLIAVSCGLPVEGGAQGGQQQQASATPTPEPTEEIPALSSPTPTPEDDGASSAEEIETLAPDAPELEPAGLQQGLETPAATPEALNRPFRLCSPLVGEALEDLWLITSDPYSGPPPGSDARHEGVDFSYYRRGERETIQGAGIQAVLSGWVATALVGTFPYGNFVILETPAYLLPEGLSEVLSLGEGQSLYTVYAHMESGPRVSIGEWVEACTLLGNVGRSGNANVAHLHLETRIGPAGAVFFQMGYYRPENTEAEKESYLRWRIGGEFRHFDPMILLNWKEEFNHE